MNLKTTLLQLTDVELLEQLCSSSDDNDFYEEFVRRFIVDLNEHCSSICKKRNLEPHIGQQITHEILERVRKYKSFRKDAIKIPNERVAVLVYLKRISLSLFNNFHKESKVNPILNKSYFDDILESCESLEDAINLKNKKEIALFIFKKLNKKEQTIILADIEHKKFQKYLPDDITDNLSLSLNVKKDSIRKIRERAIQKIKIALNELNEN